MYVELGSPNFNFPKPTLMAISQQLAILTSLRLSACWMSDFAVTLNSGSFWQYHRNV